MRLKEVILTISILALLTGCGAPGGGASPSPTQAPIPIEFNKSASAIDISKLKAVQSQTVNVGVEVCDAVQSAFVGLMQKFDGVTASSSTQLTAGGALLDISFDAWGSFGCSGDASTYPVCYQVYADHFIMLAGYITAPKTGAEMAGESGTIWLKFNPESSTLQEAIGQSLSMRVDYNRSDMNRPTILIDSNGDPDGSGPIGDITARCLITNEEALSNLPMILLQMYLIQEVETQYVARTDGTETSVKVDGEAPICVDNNGAPVAGCGTTDVGGVSYPTAPEDYDMPAEIEPFNNGAVDCVSTFAGACTYTTVERLTVDTTMAYADMSDLEKTFGWTASTSECICHSAADAGASSCLDYTIIDTYTTRCNATPVTITCPWSAINDCSTVDPIEECTDYYTYDSAENKYYNCEINSATGACQQRGDKGVGSCLQHIFIGNGCNGIATGDCNLMANMADCNNSHHEPIGGKGTLNNCYWAPDPVTGVQACQTQESECYFFATVEL